MNERIRELARQSGLKMIHDETLALGYLNTPTKKFAELIINECLDIVDKEVLGMVGVNAMKKIEEHFGIVE